MREAVLLVGGRGTRLRPLTLTTPKPMLPVAGVPFLQHQVAKLRDAGIEHIVLATSYRSEIFQSHFGDGRRLGVELTYAEEAEPLGTGGAIGNAAQSLRSAPHEPVVVYNGDVLSAHDLGHQLAQHVRAKASVTLHLVEVDDAAAYGCVPTGEDGRVTAFLEKMDAPVTNWINAGCYVFERRVMDTIPLGQVVSVERQTFPELLAAGERIEAWKQSTYWLDVGTPDSLVKASSDLVSGVFVSGEVVGAPAAWLSSQSARVDQSANVAGGSFVGSEASIAALAEVWGSVVMSGARVGEAARIDRSVLGARSVIEAGALVTQRLIGDDEVVTRGTATA